METQRAIAVIQNIQGRGNLLTKGGKKNKIMKYKKTQNKNGITFTTAGIRRECDKKSYTRAG